MRTRIQHTWQNVVNNTPYILIFALTFGAGLWRIVSIFQQTPYVERQDEYTHYFYARDSLSNWLLWLDIWGRPLNTFIYSFSSSISFEARRVFAIVLTAITILLAVGIARQLKISKLGISLLPALIWLQPWVVRFGFQSLTVIPFMCFLTAAVYLWLRRDSRTNLWAASLCFGLLPLIRHESLPLILVWIAILFRQQIIQAAKNTWQQINEKHPSITPIPDIKPVQVVMAIISLSPYLIWNYLYAAWTNDLVLASVIAPIPQDRYPPLPFSHYLSKVYEGVTLPLLVLAGLGLIVSLVRYIVDQKQPVDNQGITNDYQISRLLWWLPFIVYFIIHSVIIRYNIYGSGGYAEFVLPIAPLIALIALSPFAWIEAAQRLGGWKPMVYISTFVVYFLVALFLYIRTANTIHIPQTEIVTYLEESTQTIDLSSNTKAIITYIPQSRYHLEEAGYGDQICPRYLWNVDQDIKINLEHFPDKAIVILDDPEPKHLNEKSLHDEHLVNEHTIVQGTDVITFQTYQITSGQYDKDYVNYVCGWIDNQAQIQISRQTNLQVIPDNKQIYLQPKAIVMVLGITPNRDFYKVATRGTGMIGCLEVDAESQRKIQFIVNSELPELGGGECDR